MTILRTVYILYEVYTIIYNKYYLGVLDRRQWYHISRLNELITTENSIIIHL